MFLQLLNLQFYTVLKINFVINLNTRTSALDLQSSYYIIVQVCFLPIVSGVNGAHVQADN